MRRERERESKGRAALPLPTIADMRANEGAGGGGAGCWGARQSRDGFISKEARPRCLLKVKREDTPRCVHSRVPYFRAVVRGTLTTAQKLSEQTNRARIISI